MRKVVFLDRDGVINDDTGHYYIYKPEHFVLNNGVEESLKLIADKGYDIVIITNQGGIARGTYSKHEVEQVHKYMKLLFAKINIVPLAIYYCPHHDKFEKCLCRKPNGLMIKKAIAKYNIDVNQSFMIGDNHKDVMAANNAGIVGHKIETNQNMLSLIQQLIDG